MKILLVAPIFRPNNGVAAQRMNFFFDTLVDVHEIDVLVLGSSTCLSGQVKTIDKALFATSHCAWRNKGLISDMLKKYLINYNVVIVSLPDYGLLEIVNICHTLGVKCITDLRDQPNLSTVQQKSNNKFKNLFIKVKNILQVQYVYRRLKLADYITVVGAASTGIVQEKLNKIVINVNNGYLMEDKKFVSNNLPNISAVETPIIIGWVGNIHKFRDNIDLRKVLDQLNVLSKHNNVVLRHWGKCCPELERYIHSKDNLVYENTTNFVRKEFLTELNVCKAFLLSCSDSLIWEPTTSVFDYLLFNKPVIYTGLRNNEAFNILFNSGKRIIGLDDIESLVCEDELDSDFHFISDLYSREYAFTNMKKILDDIQKKL
jgi:hypothetical protein